MVNVDIVTYRGVVYRRYPDSPRRTDRVYFTPNGSERKRGRGRLHEEVYRDAYGPIPEGCVVHHRDEQSLNNDPANLVAVSRSGHLKHHTGLGAPREALDRARALSHAWHRTEDGRAWHRQRAVEQRFGHWQRIPLVCAQCGTTFTAADTPNARGKHRYCSPSCSAKHRRASGIDDEMRQCGICGQMFAAHRTSGGRTCSRSCAGKLISQTKRAASGRRR